MFLFMRGQTPQDANLAKIATNMAPTGQKYLFYPLQRLKWIKLGNLQQNQNTKWRQQYLTNEPYLFFYLPRFNNKLKLMNKAARKIYVVDNGFVQSTAFNLSENLGRLLENQVFVELLRRGYISGQTLFYYRTRNDKEIDFVIRKGPYVEQLIQVCYDMSSEKTRKREVEALIEATQELYCDNLLIITNSQKETIEKKGYSIKVVSI